MTFGEDFIEKYKPKMTLEDPISDTKSESGRDDTYNMLRREGKDYAARLYAAGDISGCIQELLSDGNNYLARRISAHSMKK